MLHRWNFGKGLIKKHVLQSTLNTMYVGFEGLRYIFIDDRIILPIYLLLSFPSLKNFCFEAV